MKQLPITLCQYILAFQEHIHDAGAAMATPQVTTNAWVLNSQNGHESLELKENLPLPQVEKDEVLVKLHAASLNYREVMIAKV